jgi:glycerol-3-phosphate acyltransferase PlsY
MTWALFIVAGLLIGSIPTGYLLARAAGVDLRSTGSGNIGATNLGRVLGTRAFLLCFALDAAKGLAPPLAAGLWMGLAGRFDVPVGAAMAWLGVMAAPIVGHIFCPWLGFKGGKGVATGLGALLGVFPVLTVAGLAALAVWIGVFARWRIVSLASVAGAIAAPAAVLLTAGAGRLGWLPAHNAPAWGLLGPALGVTVALGVLVIVRHRANIERLRAGAEPRFAPGSARRAGS